MAGEIRSAEVARLTSPDLAGLKALINEAATQKRSLQGDLAAALADRRQAWIKLRRREQLPLRPFYKKRLPTFRTAYEEAESEALKVLQALVLSDVRVQFEFDEHTLGAYQALEAAHRRLSRCARIWDITSLNAVDRYTTRSLASSAVTRTPVRLTSVTDGVVAGNQAGLRFQNANGGDLDFFPGFLLMRTRSSADYALIDLREVHIDVRPVEFIEDEFVPQDSTIIGQAWAKSNKDGSPDRRFANNYQIPIVRYGRIAFTTTSGLSEAYQVSDWHAASAYGEAFLQAQRAMHSEGKRFGASSALPISDIATINLDEQLPTLPTVPGAHGLTFGALALACAVISTAILGFRSQSQVSPAEFAVPAPATSPTPPANAAVSASGTLPPVTVEPLEQAQPKSRAASTPAPSPPRERLVTKQGANVRSAPDRTASILKSVNVGTVFQVFGRERDWVQVGQDVPLGWVHTSLLKAPS